MLKRSLILILILAILMPIVPMTNAEHYDTLGRLHYALVADLGTTHPCHTMWTYIMCGICPSPTSMCVSSSHSFPQRNGHRFVRWEIISGDAVFWYNYERNFFWGLLTENTHVLAIWEGDDEPIITPATPPIVPSVNSPETAYIDLAAETITLPITVGAYSVNDGRSWKTGVLPSGEVFSKMLGKGMTLWVAQGYDKKAKSPTGTTFNFPRIDRRPKANTEKLKPNKLTNTWDLRTKAGALPTATYQWAATTDRKNPSGAWQPLSDGLPPLPASKQKLTVLVRTPASATAATATSPARYVPASKAWKATVKG